MSTPIYYEIRPIDNNIPRYDKSKLESFCGRRMFVWSDNYGDALPIDPYRYNKRIKDGIFSASDVGNLFYIRVKTNDSNTTYRVWVLFRTKYPFDASVYAIILYCDVIAYVPEDDSAEGSIVPKYDESTGNYWLPTGFLFNDNNEDNNNFHDIAEVLEGNFNGKGQIGNLSEYGLNSEGDEAQIRLNYLNANFIEQDDNTKASNYYKVVTSPITGNPVNIQAKIPVRGKNPTPLYYDFENYNSNIFKQRFAFYDAEVFDRNSVININFYASPGDSKAGRGKWVLDKMLKNTGSVSSKDFYSKDFPHNCVPEKIFCLLVAPGGNGGDSTLFSNGRGGGGGAVALLVINLVNLNQGNTKPAFKISVNNEQSAEIKLYLNGAETPTISVGYGQNGSSSAIGEGGIVSVNSDSTNGIKLLLSANGGNGGGKEEDGEDMPSTYTKAYASSSTEFSKLGWAGYSGGTGESGNGGGGGASLGAGGSGGKAGGGGIKADGNAGNGLGAGGGGASYGGFSGGSGAPGAYFLWY